MAKKIQKVLEAMLNLTLTNRRFVTVAKKIQKVLEAMFHRRKFIDLLTEHPFRMFGVLARKILTNKFMTNL